MFSSQGIRSFRRLYLESSKLTSHDRLTSNSILKPVQAIAYFELMKPNHKSLIQDSKSKAKELRASYTGISESELATEIAVRCSCSSDSGI
jgi:hypothetical protein